MTFKDKQEHIWMVGKQAMVTGAEAALSRRAFIGTL